MGWEESKADAKGSNQGGGQLLPLEAVVVPFLLGTVLETEEQSIRELRDNF